MVERPLRVLMAAAECSPLARTGGLGEAVAGLARALLNRDLDVAVAIPRYRHLQDLGVEQPGAGPARAVYRHDSDGLPVLLVDDPQSFDREGIYGPRPGTAYEDQWQRFGRFALAVRELAAGYDVLHLHDGHVGPAALDAPVPSVFTVHNASYSIGGPLGETARLLQVGYEHVTPAGGLEWYGEANFLKAGLVGAGRVVAVSPSYAGQLAADPDVSGGLDGVIRALPNAVIGILNGIDAAAWDPAADTSLPARYTVRRPTGRGPSRESLLAAAGLDDGILFGNVGRMAEQKGLHLLDAALDELVAEGLRLVLVGNGELDDLVDGWTARHPSAVWHAPFTEELARLVYAGADAYLMPSRFEPCGLGQMYAMRYGCPPVVRLTGGLADTVVDLDEDPARATGFGFRPFLAEELTKSVRRAMRVLRKSRAEWRSLQRRGMSHDWSWDRAAGEYLSTYRGLLAPAREPGPSGQEAPQP